RRIVFAGAFDEVEDADDVRMLDARAELRFVGERRDAHRIGSEERGGLLHRDVAAVHASEVNGRHTPPTERPHDLKNGGDVVGHRGEGALYTTRSIAGARGMIRVKVPFLRSVAEGVWFALDPEIRAGGRVRARSRSGEITSSISVRCTRSASDCAPAWS